MLTDDALRNRLREAAHRDVRKRYSTEIVVKQLETLYRELGVQIDPINRQGEGNKACAAS